MFCAWTSPRMVPIGSAWCCINVLYPTAKISMLQLDPDPNSQGRQGRHTYLKIACSRFMPIVYRYTASSVWSTRAKLHVVDSIFLPFVDDQTDRSRVCTQREYDSGVLSANAYASVQCWALSSPKLQSGHFMNSLRVCACAFALANLKTRRSYSCNMEAMVFSFRV